MRERIPDRVEAAGREVEGGKRGGDGTGGGGGQAHQCPSMPMIPIFPKTGYVLWHYGHDSFFYKMALFSG